MTKFYLSQNAGRPVVVGGVTFTFEPCQFFAPTSSWWGVIASEDPVEIAALDAGVKVNLLEEITQDQCVDWLSKKKIASSSHTVVAMASKPMNMGSPGAPKPAVVAAPAAPTPAVESVAEALSTAPSPRKSK